MSPFDCLLEGVKFTLLVRCESFTELFFRLMHLLSKEQAQIFTMVIFLNSDLSYHNVRLLESHPSYSVFFTGRQNNNGVAHALAQHAITFDVSHAFYQLIPCIAEVLFNEMP